MIFIWLFVLMLLSGMPFWLICETFLVAFGLGTLLGACVKGKT